MAQARIALKPDGLFLAAMFGGDSLQELRIACAVAQQEREGGVSAFVSPLAQVRRLARRGGVKLRGACRRAAVWGAGWGLRRHQHRCGCLRVVAGSAGSCLQPHGSL